MIFILDPPLSRIFLFVILFGRFIPQTFPAHLGHLDKGLLIKAKKIILLKNLLVEVLMRTSFRYFIALILTDFEVRNTSSKPLSCLRGMQKNFYRKAFTFY